MRPCGPGSGSAPPHEVRVEFEVDIAFDGEATQTEREIGVQLRLVEQFSQVRRCLKVPAGVEFAAEAADGS
jgi:hypothetical protein